MRTVMTPLGLIQPATVTGLATSKGRACPWKAPGHGWLAAGLAEADVVQPLVQQAPAGVPEVGDLVEALRDVEARYFRLCRRNTRLMVTALRKLFYSGVGWNVLLVPGTWKVPVPYRTAATLEEVVVEVPDFPHFVYLREKDEKRAVDLFGKEIPAGRMQEVRLSDGTSCDVGHVLAGLDARLHRGVVGIPGLFQIRDNLGACTWIGDLGSVLAEVCIQAIQRGAGLDVDAINQILSNCNPACDMAGNADAHLVGKGAFDTASGGPVSGVLERFYSQSCQARYVRFQETIGFPSSQSGTAQWVESHLDAVRNAAAMYIGVSTRGAGSVALASIVALHPSVESVARMLLRRFAAALKTVPAES